MTTGLRALPLILIVTAGSQPAYAQHFLVCYPVRPGDTAARFALRLTGSAENRHEPWFRIVDTTAARTIAKAEYGLILPGWRVCIAQEMLRASAHTQSVQIGLTEKRAAIDRWFLWWTVPLLVVLAVLLAWFVTVLNLGKRQAIVDTMRPFGEKFVREFERPLFQQRAQSRVEGRDADHPIRSRLRFAPHRDRLEVLLAPTDGRTYPNLSDHRRNLEYDVERVLQLLGDEPFSSGPFYAEGQWVVIPFQLKTTSKQEGVN